MSGHHHTRKVYRSVDALGCSALPEVLVFQGLVHEKLPLWGVIRLRRGNLVRVLDYVA